jgi:hypothetical protein
MALLDKLQKDGTTLTPLRGTRPTATLVKDVIQVNNTFSKGQYQNFVVNTSRAQDLTGNP